MQCRYDFLRDSQQRRQLALFRSCAAATLVIALTGTAVFLTRGTPTAAQPAEAQTSALQTDRSMSDAERAADEEMDRRYIIHPSGY
ncbi:MAG: hypothetical protein BroJett031_22800 [Betaproteobacteria bacterium]|nr:MAG: hypothetical protein BroJett031_22800 [Betaproteobacteria bacterium]